MSLHKASFPTSFALALALAFAVGAPATLYAGRADAACNREGPSQLIEIPVSEVPPVVGMPYYADLYLVDPCGYRTYYKRVIRFVSVF